MLLHFYIPLRFIKERDIWSSKYFLPQANCLAEVLKNEGYQTALIKAADITFTNANIFALTHGYNEALGVDESEVLEVAPEVEEETEEVSEDEDLVVDEVETEVAE